IIGEQLKVAVVVLAYLKERNLNGILSGMTRTDAQQKYPVLVERHDQWQYIDGSERTEDFNNRVKTSINLILNMRYSSMIVVTHGLFLKTLFKEFLKENLVSIGDAAFILVEFVNEKPT